jgi:hypothetical protein
MTQTNMSATEESPELVVEQTVYPLCLPKLVQYEIDGVVAAAVLDMRTEPPDM